MPEKHQDIVEPGVNAQSKTGRPRTVWGHKSESVATPYQNPQNILRKTNLFGVLKIVDGKVVPPKVPLDQVNQYGLLDLDPKNLKPGESIYYPDMLNDLQLTDHYPLLQETAIGTVCTLNLMKQCREFEPRGQGNFNNAFNKTETDAEYQARLDKLADLIIAMVKENDLPLFTLQEAPSGEVGRAFYAKIERETGCKFASDDISREKAGLVTLYDPKKLTPGKSVVSSTPKAKEQRLEFTPIPPVSGKPFYVTNVHWKLENAPDGVNRMIASLEKANKPDATHNHLFMGDTNLCANAHAVEKLTDSELKAGQNKAHIAAKTANLQGATSYVEGTLDQSKGGVTTTDMAFGSAGLMKPVASTQQSLYVDDVTAPFQRSMEEARRENEKIFESDAVKTLMHAVSTKAVEVAPSLPSGKPTSPQATSSAATVESFDALKGMDAAQKKKIIEAEMAAMPGNKAMVNFGIKFADVTVTAKDDEHIIALRAIFPGQNGAADVARELTITRAASPDGQLVVRRCDGEGLTVAQKYAIIAAASFEERKQAGKTDTTITVAIKSTGQTPGKDGLTEDERALVKAYLAAGYTEVTCGKDKKCYTEADFKAATVSVEERSVQGWRRAAKAEPAVTFDHLMQLATAVQNAQSAEAKASALESFQDAVEVYESLSNKADMTAKIAALPEVERQLATQVAEAVKDIEEIKSEKLNLDRIAKEQRIADCMSKFGDEVNPNFSASVTLE